MLFIGGDHQQTPIFILGLILPDGVGLARAQTFRQPMVVVVLLCSIQAGAVILVMTIAHCLD